MVEHILEDREGTEIAIVSMTGRFPKARNLEQFWQNLRDGVEGMRPLSEEELDALGVDSAVRQAPNFVPVSSAMDDIDLFDANFFDYTPREAEIMDPQQRVFLECCWEALERAGHDPAQTDGLIGVFAGGTTSNYLIYNLVANQEIFNSIDPGQVDIGNGSDFISTRVSYKFNLRGPSFTVQTACSTSLVATHLACQSLLNFECDMALAGGIAIHVEHPRGYQFVEGSILAPDGHVRAFDADAAGTVFGSGVGVVVLKRLEDAVADGNHIHAIIRGSAVNNDGSGKVGYVAPSVDGQAEVIIEALSVANVDADSISYVETHGAGTRLGDPIEIRALTKAFRANTDQTGFCDIGSAKTYVGHLTGAAGVAGLIKTVLSLENKQIPPILHYQQPNPEINFDETPFVPTKALKPWAAGDEPRRAGVSSFGLGGTNAHVVLEEVDQRPPSGPSRPRQLLVLSAKTATALTSAETNLAQFLRDNPDLNLADAAYTLKVGRQAMAHRRVLVVADADDAIAKLSQPNPDLTAKLGKQPKRDVTFFLPATSPSPAALADLAASEPAFADALAECADALPAPTASALRSLMAGEVASAEMPPSLLAVVSGYALATLWKSWGVAASAFFGEGIGEVTASVLAGVLSLRDALALANDPAAAGQLAPTLLLNEPELPLISAETGDWLAPDATHFSQLNGAGGKLTDAWSTLAQDEQRLVVALGPTTLDALAGFPSEADATLDQMLTALGRVWLSGIAVSWPDFYADEQRYRVVLPTYPFERRRFWIDPDTSDSAASATTAKVEKQPDLTDWFYAPTWTSAPAPRPASPETIPAERWLIFADETGISAEIVQQLAASSATAIVVGRGDGYSADTDGRDFVIHPTNPADYDALFDALGTLPDRIVHAWSVTATDGSLQSHLDDGFYSLAALGRVLDALAQEPITLDVVTNQLFQLTEAEPLQPTKATLLGACRVMGQELANVRCRVVDVVASPQITRQLMAHVLDDDAPATAMLRGNQRWLPSYAPAPLAEEEPPLRPLRENGVYLITGGLSDIGLELAKHLAQTANARLALVDANAAPPDLADELRAAGAADVVAVQANLANSAEMAAALDLVDQRWGALHGVVHSPSVPAAQVFQPLQDLTPISAEGHFVPKVQGLLTLDGLLSGRELDFCVVSSALSVALGGVGFAAFTAAAFALDAIARHKSQTSATPWLSINWDVWQFDADMENLASMNNSLGQLSLTPQEGGEVLRRVLQSATTSQVLISTAPLAARLAQESQKQAASSQTLYERPDLWTEYVAPRNDTEEKVVAIWEQVLGIERIGVEDNFFELGGHSLLATQLRNQLFDTFYVELPLQSLLENATAAGIAELVEQHQPAEGEQKPIRDQLREAFAVERPAIMERYLRQKIATSLEMSTADLPEDGSLAELELSLATVDLMWNLKRDFKVQFYPHEILGRDRFSDLATFVLEQVDRMDNLPSYATDKPLSAYTIRQHRERSDSAEFVGQPASNNQNMVFLLSSPRSGSTLMRVMLAGHPGIFCPPEISLLFFRDMDEWQQNVSFGQDFTWPAEGLHWALVELLGLEPDEGWAYIHKLVAEKRSVPEVYAEIQELAGDRLVIDKTPPYAMDMDTLKHGEQFFNKPKYIHLVRHPYSMIESFLRVRLDQQFSSSLFEETNPDPYIIAETIWATANRNLLTFFDNHVDPERHHLLRYEDMVKDPRTVMTKLCDFLEIPFNEALLNPYDGRRERMMGGIGDPNILQHTGIDPKLGDVWQTISLPRPLDPSTKALAHQFNYELPDNVVRPAPQAAPVSQPVDDLALPTDLDNLSDEEVATLLNQLMMEEGEQ